MKFDYHAWLGWEMNEFFYSFSLSLSTSANRLTMIHSNLPVKADDLKTIFDYSWMIFRFFISPLIKTSLGLIDFKFFSLSHSLSQYWAK